MNNISFAPDNNSINNAVPPLTPQYSAPEPKHFLNKKFAIAFVILILLGAGAYAGIWYWQKQQVAQEVVPTFTPRPSATPDPTADWKTYTNTSLGFSVQYPLNLAPTLELNDQYNRLTSFGPSKTNTTFEVRLYKDTDPDMGIKYGFLGSETTATNIKLGGITGFEAVSTTGYCDGPGCGKPYVEFASRHNGNVYHLIFYGDATVSAEENQILSTFKFTDSAGLVNSFAKCIADGYPTRPSDPKLGEESGGQRCIASDSMVFVKYDGFCAQVITKARNPKTGETGEFATPCDVPQGWQKI